MQVKIMFEFVAELFDTTGFVPRKNCGEWTPSLIWMHVGGDLFIWLAYISIPLILLHFTRRRDLPFPRMFTLFALFILACGFGHFIEALMFKYPLYRLAGVWKVFTAVVSWATVFALISVVPRATKTIDEAANSSRPPSAGPTGFGDTTLHRLARPLQRDVITDYIVALLAGVLALLIRAAVDPIVDSDHVYVLSLLAVVFISWRSGFGPGIVTLAVSMLGMIFFFVGRRHTLIIEGFGNQLATAMFFFCGVGCAGLGEAQRRARLATKKALAVALERKAELEIEMARRREAEETIRESEGRFRSMADSAPAMIWLSDLDQRRTYFNRTWLAFTGRAVNQELGNGWIENVHRADREKYLEAYSTAFAARDSFELEYRLRRHDGNYRWVLARGTPRFTPSGAFAGFVGLCLDVTDRKQAEEAVTRSEKNLSDFFENANVGLHWVGPDGIILRANQAELELLGYSREEYVGCHISEFHADVDVIADILTRLKKGERLDNFPARMRRKDGTIRDVLISSTVLWEDGRFVHSRCFTRDVTELKQGAEDLRRSEARYRTLTEAIPQMVWNAGADGEVSYFNQRWQEYTGVPIDKAAGREWLNAVHPEDTERLYSAWQQTVRNSPGAADLPTARFDGCSQSRSLSIDRTEQSINGSVRWRTSTTRSDRPRTWSERSEIARLLSNSRTRP
jgi:PAS domain S-box-containing protein